MTARQIVEFEDFQVDPGRGELRRAGHVIAVEPQVFDLIAFLSANPGRILSRDEIIDAVWQGRFVSDSAVSTRINAARAALGDDGKAQRVIRTMPRRGFLFVPETLAVQRALHAVPDTDADPFSFANKPSVAVLPFENMSGDPEQAYFSDGITDDIITDLARYEELLVIARHSSFAYRERNMDERDIARELGVSYIASGSVRRSGNRVRVTVQLIDAASGAHVWAERYDRELQDIFAVQDEITALIVNSTVGRLTSLHNQRALARAPGATDAYDHALRAMELLWKVGPKDNLAARTEAEKAVAIAPGFARAHAVVSWAHLNQAINRWSDDPDTSFRLANKSALAAVAADDRDPWAHATHGFAEIWYKRAHDRGLDALGRSLALNPSSAHFRAMTAFCLIYSGQHERALDELAIAMRLNPHHPVLYLAFLGRALFHLRRFDEAIGPLERCAIAMPAHSNALALTAACYAALNRLDDARAMVRQLEAASGDYRSSTLRGMMPYAKSVDLEFYLDMLRRAGLPE